jgi:hypothetical protein
MRARGSSIILTLLALFSAAVLLWLWLGGLADRDGARLDAERSRRLALARTGQALPGTPDLGDLAGRLTRNGLTAGAPVFIRIFKREFELELWLKRDDRYHRFAIYPVCRFSGGLGPKLVEGDHQSPEGFYTIDRRSLNPHSRWHRAFNLGFPNALDREHGRTGSFLMVHGGCSSVGCYAMTNPVIDEVWRLVDAALKAGQKTVHVHVFPFRMTSDNIEARSAHRWAEFWREIKPGFDAFEETQVPPRVSVCGSRYQIERRDDDLGDAGEIGPQCGTVPGLPRHVSKEAQAAPRRKLPAGR